MWLLITVSAYFIQAGNSLIDKYLLRSAVATPIVYTFYVGIFSIFSVVFIIFDWTFPSLPGIAFDFLVGLIFLIALYLFFSALRGNEASRVVSVIGATTPVLIVIFSAILLGEHNITLLGYQSLALLILGGILVSVRDPKRVKKVVAPTVDHRTILFALFSSVFFALYFITAEIAFNTQPFTGAFVMTRVGSFVAALLLLLLPMTRHAIVRAGKSAAPSRVGVLFVFNKALAGIGFFMLNLGIAQAGAARVNVAFVHALESTKFVFVLLMALAISYFFPHILSEEFTRRELIRKVSGVGIIVIGTFLLAISSVV